MREAIRQHEGLRMVRSFCRKNGLENYSCSPASVPLHEVRDKPLDFWVCDDSVATLLGYDAGKILAFLQDMAWSSLTHFNHRRAEVAEGH